MSLALLPVLNQCRDF